jgi:natural product precursor
MKEIKFEGKLNLKKETIAKLNDEQMGELKGGGVLSIGQYCSHVTGTCGPGTNTKIITKGWFC